MQVILSGVLQKHVRYQREHNIQADTLNEALDKIASKFPRIRSVLLDPTGNLRRVHRAFLNGKQVNEYNGAEELHPDDRLEILTTIAGG